MRRGDTVDRAVLVIAHLVERGDIHAFDLRRRDEKVLLTPALALCLAVQIGKLEHDLLAVADHEQVDEVCQRLGIVGARAAAGDDMLEFRAIPCQHGHATKIEHVGNVGKGQLILQRESNDIKLIQRIAALQSVERDTGPSHLVLHIDPGRADTLAPDVLLVVKQAIQDARAEMRHSDLVGIREAECEAQDRPPLCFSSLSPIPRRHSAPAFVHGTKWLPSFYASRFPPKQNTELV